GDVDGEAVGAVDPGPSQRLVEALRPGPARVPGVQVDAGVRLLLEPVDRAREESVPLLVVLPGRAVVPGGEDPVRFQDGGGAPVADAPGDLVDPAPVGVRVGGAALGELAAVAVGDVVEDEERLTVGGGGALGEPTGLGLGVVGAYPLGDGPGGDPLDQ